MNKNTDTIKTTSLPLECPYCGFEREFFDDDSTIMQGDWHGNMETIFKCRKCKKTFIIQQNIVYTIFKTGEINFI